MKTTTIILAIVFLTGVSYASPTGSAENQPEHLSLRTRIYNRYLDHVGEGAEMVKSAAESGLDFLEKIYIPGFTERIVDIRDYVHSSIRTYLMVLDKETFKSLVDIGVTRMMTQQQLHAE